MNMWVKNFGILMLVLSLGLSALMAVKICAADEPTRAHSIDPIHIDFEDIRDRCWVQVSPDGHVDVDGCTTVEWRGRECERGAEP